jgi:hypothetical protein
LSGLYLGSYRKFIIYPTIQQDKFVFLMVLLFLLYWSSNRMIRLMTFLTVRHLIFAVALCGLQLAALGQTRTTEAVSAPVSEKNSIQSIESTDPLSNGAARSQGLTELINDESAVLFELRRGLNRLNKTCVSNTATKSEAENAQLSRATLAFEQGLAAVDARRDAQQRATSLLETAARRKTAQQCTGLGSGVGFNFLKSTRCQEAEKLQSNVNVFRNDLDRFYRLQAERYQTFLELVQMERRSCVRAGFSTRLLQANEVHMRESELQTQRSIERWTRDLGRQLGTGGELP